MKKIIYILLFTFLIINHLNAQFSVNRIDGTPFTNNEVIEFNNNEVDVKEYEELEKELSSQSSVDKDGCS